MSLMKKVFIQRPFFLSLKFMVEKSLTGSPCTNGDGAWNGALPGTRTFISVLLTSGREHD